MMKPNITPVGTFQRITSTAPLRAETREAIQNTVLQFYVQNSQPEDDAEGLTACYERLSQEDKLDGESNSIINQKKIWRSIAATTAIPPSGTTTRTTVIPGQILLMWDKEVKEV